MIIALEILKDSMKQKLDSAKKMSDKQFWAAKEKIANITMAISHIKDLYETIDKQEDRITNLERKYLLAYQSNVELKRKIEKRDKEIFQYKELYLKSQEIIAKDE